MLTTACLSAQAILLLRSSVFAPAAKAARPPRSAALLFLDRPEVRDRLVAGLLGALGARAEHVEHVQHLSSAGQRLPVVSLPPPFEHHCIVHIDGPHIVRFYLRAPGRQRRGQASGGSLTAQRDRRDARGGDTYGFLKACQQSNYCHCSMVDDLSYNQLSRHENYPVTYEVVQTLASDIDSGLLIGIVDQPSC